jgi:F-type H+-transporting ATPase subunit delta
LHPALRGYLTAVVGDAVRAEVGDRLADEINAVAHLVSRTGDLAVTLTDFGVPLAARKAVLSDLLSERVHPLVLRVVLRAVETERAEELPTVFHDLYELARHMHELGPQELRAEEPILGRTAWRQYASGFAAAVFEGVADTSGIEDIEDELFRFTRIVEANPGLRVALADPTTPVTGRRQLIDDLLSGKVRGETLQLVTVLLEGHVRDVVASLDWLVEQAAQARGWRVARVRAARRIDDDERRQLAQELQRISGQPVELQVTEDPSLLGGAVVQIGDLLVDASAQHRLDQLEEHLLGTEGTTRGAQN